MKLNWLTVPFKKKLSENFTSQPNERRQILTRGNFLQLFSTFLRATKSVGSKHFSTLCADSTTC